MINYCKNWVIVFGAGKNPYSLPFFYNPVRFHAGIEYMLFRAAVCQYKIRLMFSENIFDFA